MWCSHWGRPIEDGCPGPASDEGYLTRQTTVRTAAIGGSQGSGVRLHSSAAGEDTGDAAGHFRGLSWIALTTVSLIAR